VSEVTIPPEVGTDFTIHVSSEDLSLSGQYRIGTDIDSVEGLGLKPFSLDAFPPVSGGFRVPVDTTTNATYTLEFTTDLELVPWEDYSPPMVGDGTRKTFLVQRNIDLIFFRIRQEEL